MGECELSARQEVHRFCKSCSEVFEFGDFYGARLVGWWQVESLLFSW